MIEHAKRVTIGAVVLVATVAAWLGFEWVFQQEPLSYVIAWAVLIVGLVLGAVGLAWFVGDAVVKLWRGGQR